MLDLSFVQDEELRSSLESDFLEIEKAYNNKSLKAIHVLSGSIIEALLLETITSVDLSADRQALLKMHLDKLIPVAVKLGILSEKEQKLSEVVKDYRNLIHPGRLIRLGESISEDTASIAVSLINVISKKLETEQNNRIGYSANEIINKMENDIGFPSIIQKILDKSSLKEKFKLVSDIIPRRLQGLDFNTAREYVKVYHSIVDHLPDKYIEQLEHILIKEIEVNRDVDLDAYFQYLFSISTINKFSPESKDLIISYALNRFKRLPLASINVFYGFSTLEENNIENFLDSLLDKVVNYYEEDKLIEAIALLGRENVHPEGGALSLYNLFEKRYKRWKSALDSGIASSLPWEIHKERLEDFYSRALVLPF